MLFVHSTVHDIYYYILFLRLNIRTTTELTEMEPRLSSTYDIMTPAIK